MTAHRRYWKLFTAISTHILTKRMTVCNCPSWTRTNISTHILTKRMTSSSANESIANPFQLTSSRRGWLICLTLPVKGEYFNSHPHEEDDCTCNVVCRVRELISTHILTKRMTYCDRHCLIAQTYFNSHPHEEDDVCRQEIYSVWSISTHILTKRMT